MDLKQGLQHWAEQWRSLKAWGRPLDEITIEIRQRRKGRHASGLALYKTRRIVVTAACMPRGLETVLHEMAHLAVPGGSISHGDWWRRVFTDAIREVTGRTIVPDMPRHALYEATESAVEHWWRSSSHAFAWSLVSKTSSRRK